uniref:Ionotropic glutamate receptor C-terminal domain-containing protein n=1 Tax=Trichogramma kaykai TaxID=54128 RepID=A0ABD2VR08_9HYME
MSNDLLNKMGNWIYSSFANVLVFGAYLVHTKDPYPVDRTTSITFERVCGLVPLISKPTLRLSSSIQWSLLLMLSLVAIVWLSSLLLLRSNSGDGTSSLKSYWRPLDIGLIMMGASISARAVTLRERILFGCVLVVGLFYSSSILAHLTSLNLDLKAHKKFETYRDLEESGLIPFINPYMFNMTFRESNDPTLHRLGKKAYQNPDDLICLGWLLDHANVSCIFGEKYNLCLLELYSGRMKQAEPCFWSSYRVIIMRQGSPYTLSFNRIIRAIQESGIVWKWWQRFHENSVSSHKSHEKISINSSPRFIEAQKRRHRLKNNSDWRVFFLLFAGYVLSLTVFSMELIFKQLYTKLQRQCLLFPSKLDNLHGYRLRVGFYNDPPFSWGSHESLKIDGFVSVLLEMLQLQLNFNVELDFLMDYPLLNNTYSDPLVQIVSNRRLDVFAAGAFLVHVQKPYQQFWVEQLVDVTIIGISSRVSKHHHKIAIVNHETDYAATKDHFPIQ